MGRISPYGVCYDIENSPYISEVNGFNFYFSSMPHKEKFDKNLEKRRLWLDDSLSRRFNVSLNTGMLSVFQLYKQIETRGFYIVDMRQGISGSIAYKCLDRIKMNVVV